MAHASESGSVRLTTPREGDACCDVPHLATSAVHWLPCGVAFNGTAKVSGYFDPHVTEVESGAGEAPLREGCFRGRGLKGAQLELPPGFRGFVLEDAAGQQTDTGPSQWEAAASFGGITYWNHEGRPLDTDAQQRLLAWLPLSQKMHAEISPEAVEKRLSASTSAVAEDAANRSPE